MASVSAHLHTQVLLMAMKDMNIAKLTSTDLPLFSGIIQDLFPGVETPVIDYGKVSKQLRLIHSLFCRVSNVCFWIE